MPADFPTDSPARCPVCGQAAVETGGVCRGCAGGLMRVSVSGSSPAAPRETPRPEVPGWEMLRLLAVGGMGRLWLARGAGEEETREAVIKVADPSRGEAGETRLEREAEILARLDHPHILRLLDVATAADGRLALVLEHIDGCDLRRLLRAEKLPRERALEIFTKVCDAVAHAHERGIVHRDLKPSNILVSASGTVKVADFGLARTQEEAGGLSLRTAAGDGLGTPYYLAPEMLRDAATADERADVYALGVLLYELLSGTVPLGAYEPLSRRCGLDRGWDALLRDALRQDPAQRLGRVSQLRDRAAALWRREQRRGLWRVRRRWLVAAAAVLVSGFLGALVARREEAPLRPVFPKPETATAARPWTNSLGMAFVPVPEGGILFARHEVRVRDMAAFREYEQAIKPSYRLGSPPRRRLGVMTADGWTAQQEADVSDPGFPVTPDHPAGGIFPKEAHFFCAWLTLREQAEGRLSPRQYYRLPRVGEWRAAAGSLDGTEGNFAGPEARDGAWPESRPVRETADLFPRGAPAGSFAPNALALHDMAGNVSELAVPDEAREDDSGYFLRFLRLGGSWAELPGAVNDEASGDPPRAGVQRADIGFRCVLDLGESGAGE